MRTASLKTCLMGCVALGLCACPPVRTPVPRARAVEVYRPYTLTLDGRPLVPEQVYSLHGEPEKLRPGDVVVVGDVPIVLGEERYLRLVWTKLARDRLLHSLTPDGRRQLIGVSVGWSPRSGRPAALARLTPAELRGLRGLHLEAWPAGTEMQLNQLALDQICISVRTHAMSAEEGFPVLPGGLRCLLLSEGSWSSEHPRVTVPFHRFRDLRVLSIQYTSGDEPLDARRLSANRALQVLEVITENLGHADALSVLTAVRDLNLGYVRILKDISFVSSMKRLVRLNIYRAETTSLAPLEGLRFLAVVDANSADLVQVLPAGSMPALRQLRVLSSRLTTPAVERFRAANPQCEVDFGWAATLRRTARGADRLRVRAGGTCDGPPQGPTLLERRDPREVAAFVDLVASLTGPKDNQWGMHAGACCCGDPTVELYQGNRLLAALSVHGGRTLRWSGRWPGDLFPSAAGSDRLVAFLSARGIHGPARELAQRRADDAVRERENACFEANLPKDLVELFWKSETPAQVVGVLAGLAPLARATMVLKLIGCDEGSWEEDSRLDRLLIDGPVKGIDAATFSAVLRAGLADPVLANGAARAIFFEQLHGRIPAAELARAMPALAAVGLSHPQAANRHLTLKALGRIGTAAAVIELKRYLRNPVKPRVVDEAATLEPRRRRHDPSKALPPVEGASELAHAAYRLAELGDRASLPLIRTYAGTATGADRTLLLRAVSMLEQPPPARRPARGTKR